MILVRVLEQVAVAATAYAPVALGDTGMKSIAARCARILGIAVASLAMWGGGGLAVAGLAAGSISAFAQDANAAGAALDVGEAPSAAAVVDGFRSAKFGMTSDEVLKAIESDFNLSGDAVVAGENRAERTRLLTVMVPDLLPEGGVAQVSYVFGYTSGGLIQVGVSWSRQTDPEMNEDKLQANAEVLVSYFQSQRYNPESIRSGLLLDDGVLLFRGEDEEGRSSILLMQGQFMEAEGGQRVLAPVSLALLYAADSENPDVFSIAPGQF
jgi:hypothetical protein